MKFLIPMPNPERVLVFRLLRVVLMLLTLNLSACGLFGTSGSGPTSALDDDSKDWKEVEAQLPRAPQAADLVAFYVSPATDYRFSIDRKSISVGQDHVVRYTLVGISEQGARNVSYEGMRCDTREKKLYALGRPDGTWVKSRNNQWEAISELNANRQHAALAKDLICIDGLTPPDVKPILARLK